MQRAQLLSTAIEAALRAGKIQRTRYGGTFEIRHKGLIDLVTEVDRLCEEAIKDTIQARCPGHDILAEETGLSEAGGEFLWVVDPLDGTTQL